MSVAQKDYLLQFVNFINQSAARDKICRTLQYFSLFLRSFTEQRAKEIRAAKAAAEAAAKAKAKNAPAKPAPKPAGTPPTVATAFHSIEELDTSLAQIFNAMGMCRKILRFGRPIELIRLILSSNPKNLTTTLEMLSKVFLCSYFLFDHIQFFRRVNVLTVSDRAGWWVGKLTEGSWAGEVACSLPLHIIKLNEAINEEKKLIEDGKLTVTDQKDQKDQKEQKDPAVAYQEALAAVRVRKAASIRNTISYLADVPIVLYFLEATNKITPRLAGFCGTISSLIGAYNIWIATKA